MPVEEIVQFLNCDEEGLFEVYGKQTTFINENTFYTENNITGEIQLYSFYGCKGINTSNYTPQRICELCENAVIVRLKP